MGLVLLLFVLLTHRQGMDTRFKKAVEAVDSAFHRQAYENRKPTEWAEYAIDCFTHFSHTAISEEEKEQTPELTKAVMDLLIMICGGNFRITEETYDSIKAFLNKKDENEYFKNYTIRLAIVQFWLNACPNQVESFRCKMREDFRTFASMTFSGYAY